MTPVQIQADADAHAILLARTRAASTRYGPGEPIPTTPAPERPAPPLSEAERKWDRAMRRMMGKSKP